MRNYVGRTFLMTANPIAAEQPGAPEGTGQSERDSSRSATVCEPSTLGSPYIPVDSWVYPAVLRLYSLGYVDHVYLGMRPWTRASLSHMLEDIDAQIEDANTYGVSTAGEAQDIYAALIHFLHYDAGMQCLTHQGNYHIESVYSVARGISGTSLRDSFHLRLDHHQRLRPSLRERDQQLLRRQRLCRRRPVYFLCARRVPRRALGCRLLPNTGPGAQHD
jgi:hypothetical protein